MVGHFLVAGYPKAEKQLTIETIADKKLRQTGTSLTTFIQRSFKNSNGVAKQENYPS